MKTYSVAVAIQIEGVEAKSDEDAEDKVDAALGAFRNADPAAHWGVEYSIDDVEEEEADE